MYLYFNLSNYIPMYSIIIERSKEQMQIVWVFTKEVLHNTKDLSWTTRAYANELSANKTVNDYDVLYFNTLEELNNFLLDNLKL